MINFLMAQPQTAQGAQQPNALLSFLPFILIIAVFYVIMILPQQKKKKKMREMIEGLKKGDKILTSGGLIGNVIGIKADIISIKIEIRVKLRYTRTMWFR